MQRDVHVIRGERSDLLFFPCSYRLFRLSHEEARTLAKWQADPGAPLPPGRCGQVVAAEAAHASPITSPSWGETDNLCLYVAQDCNLRCAYCYNDRGRAAGPGKVMAPDIANAAFRRFFATPGRRYTAAMYGGEPLLNFHGVQAIVEAGARLAAERGIRIDFSITTNGTLLDEARIRYLGERFASISVSVDGPKEDHDRYRLSPKGSAHEKVMAHLSALLACCGDKVSLLGTLTGATAGRYGEMLDYLRGLGTGRVMLSPVDGADDAPAAMTPDQYAAYSRQHQDLCVAAIERGLEGGGPREAVNVVANLLTRRRLHRYCNAGCNPAVAADGTLYACHGLVGVEAFAMGNVAEGEDAAYRQVQERFATLHVDGMARCAACWARYLCGGQCYAQAHFRCGDAGVPDQRYCDHARRCLSACIESFVAAVGRPETRDCLYANARRLIGAGRGDIHG